jgi:hypothetical protein
MMYRLNIDNGVEVELKHDLKCMLHGSLICFEFRRDERTVASNTFLMPNHYDDLVSFLFDLSMTHTIDRAFRHTQVCNGQTYLSAYEFILVASTNHQTNITPAFMDVISNWNDIMNKEVQDGKRKV